MREGGSGSGGRECGLRKGTSEERTGLGVDRARKRGGGRKRAEEGGCNGARKMYLGGAWEEGKYGGRETSRDVA